jgi:hypothetical protein
VSRPRAALRYLLAWTMLLAPALAAWWLAPAWLALLALPFGAALLDGERRTLYDRLAGTRLVVDETGRR